MWLQGAEPEADFCPTLTQGAYLSTYTQLQLADRDSELSLGVVSAP